MFWGFCTFSSLAWARHHQLGQMEGWETWVCAAIILHFPVSCWEKRPILFCQSSLLLFEFGTPSPRGKPSVLISIPVSG